MIHINRTSAMLHSTGIYGECLVARWRQLVEVKKIFIGVWLQRDKVLSYSPGLGYIQNENGCLVD